MSKIDKSHHFQRGRKVTLHGDGNSKHDISGHKGCSKTAVHNVIRILIAVILTKKNGCPTKTKPEMIVSSNSSLQFFKVYEKKKIKLICLSCFHEYRCELLGCSLQISQGISTEFLQIYRKTKIECGNENETRVIHQKAWTFDGGAVCKHYVLWWLPTTVFCCASDLSPQERYEKYTVQTMRHLSSQIIWFIFPRLRNNHEWSKVSRTVAV